MSDGRARPKFKFLARMRVTRRNCYRKRMKMTTTTTTTTGKTGKTSKHTVPCYNNQTTSTILHWLPPDISTVIVSMMATSASSFVHDTDKRSPLHCRPPPPPSTPSLTKQILTMVSSSGNHNMPTTMNEFSNNMNAGGDSSPDNNYLPPSPTDSVTQAMKTDLEELIGYIDGLAFDKMTEGTMTMAATTTATPPSTNKQLFSTTDTHHFGSSISNDERVNIYSNRKSKDDVFRDRTNRFSGAEDNKDKKNNTPQNMLQLQTGQQYSKILDPSGSPPTRDEPAGSPPSREASLYFHDESLSLILSLSKSEDGDDEIVEEDMMGPSSSTTPRLLSTFQKNGIIVSSPDRAKTISFQTVSKDATPSKSKEGNNSATNDDEVRKFDIRKGTPYPHYRRIQIDEKVAEDNEKDRIGNNKCESSIQLQTTPARRAISFLPVAIVGTPVVEENEYKTMTTPITTNGDHDNCELEMDSTTNATYLNRKATPFPIRRRDYGSNDNDNDNDNDNNNSNIQGTNLETPIPKQQQNEQSSKLVLTSPESAKKLLQTAVDALRDARQERESARQWAKDIKDSVNQWVVEQRQLIRTESQSASVSGDSPVSTEFLQQHHQAIEDSINNLRHEINHKISSRSETENQLHMLMTKQDEQIRELSNQMIVMKEQLACIVKEGGVVKRTTLRSQRDADPTSQSDYKASNSRYNKDETQSIEHKTPKSNRIALPLNASHSETSAISSHASHRTKRTTPSGGHLIDYGNGTSKEVHPDGTTVTRFRNGDVETRFGATKNVTCSSPSSSCVVAYYHSKEKVLQITQNDGSVLYEYSSGQVERHCADGVKIILFPDGTKTIV